jgi:hypothetical protein
MIKHYKFKGENRRIKNIGNPAPIGRRWDSGLFDAILLRICSQEKKNNERKDWPIWRFFPTKGSIQGNKG